VYLVFLQCQGQLVSIFSLLDDKISYSCPMLGLLMKEVCKFWFFAYSHIKMENSLCQLGAY